MLRTFLKKFLPLFISNLLGCLIAKVIFYAGFHYTKYQKGTTVGFFIMTTIDFVHVAYNTYIEKSKYKNSSVLIPDSVNDIEMVGEKLMVEIPGLIPQGNQSHNSVFKILAILTIVIFCRYFTSKWKLSFAICLDYIFYECLQFCQRICSRPFLLDKTFSYRAMNIPFIATKDWTNKKIASMAILLDLIKFLLYLCIVMITCHRVIPYICDEMDNYTRYILTSEVATSSLKYRIETYIALIIDKYSEYLPLSMFIIAGKFWTQL